MNQAGRLIGLFFLWIYTRKEKQGKSQKSDSRPENSL